MNLNEIRQSLKQKLDNERYIQQIEKAKDEIDADEIDSDNDKQMRQFVRQLEVINKTSKTAHDVMKDIEKAERDARLVERIRRLQENGHLRSWP